MTAYALPAKFGFVIGTVMDVDTGVVTDRTDDGKDHARDLYANPYYTINAQWRALTREDWPELRAFLLTTRTVPFSVDVDGDAYTVRLIGNPRVTYAHGVGMVDVSAQLRGTRDAD